MNDGYILGIEDERHRCLKIVDEIDFDGDMPLTVWNYLKSIVHDYESSEKFCRGIKEEVKKKIRENIINTSNH